MSSAIVDCKAKGGRKEIIEDEAASSKLGSSIIAGSGGKGAVQLSAAAGVGSISAVDDCVEQSAIVLLTVALPHLRW